MTTDGRRRPAFNAKTKGTRVTLASRRFQSVPAPRLRTAFRAVDGNRSPWYAALKRRAEVADGPGDYRLTLKEQRQILIPWLRIPIYTYWHSREFYGVKIARIETSARVFLETGHMPAQWFI